MADNLPGSKEYSFFSDGIKLNAKLFSSEKNQQDQPPMPIVFCSGYTGLISLYPTLFSRYLCSQNCAVLGFDYRGQGASEGIRERIIFEEQVSDIRNAVRFLDSLDEVDTSRGVGLVGWGMGAALAIHAAYRNPQVSRIACLNGFYDGERFYQYALAQEEKEKLEAASKQASKSRSQNGEETFVDPFQLYPLDGATAKLVKEKLSKDENFTQRVSIEFFESIRRMNALQIASSLEAPVFIAHGKQNPLHPIVEANRLRARVAPPSTFYEIDGTHNDFMEADNPTLAALCTTLANWFSMTQATVKARTRELSHAV